MEEFAKMIANQSNLFVLGLEFNRIDSEGASLIFKAIEELKSFEKLFLNQNEIKKEIGAQI